jgi:hypothetical protein
MISYLLLAAASLGLLGMVAAQDYLYPPLREKTISSGLTGPYHWWLDAAFLCLSAALVGAFWGHGVSAYLAIASSVFLVLTGISGTFTTWLDAFTSNQGEVWHTRFTAVTFVLAIALQFVTNGPSVLLWCMTLGGMLFPIATHFLVPNASVTEKVGVTQLCLWLVAWSVSEAWPGFVPW